MIKKPFRQASHGYVYLFKVWWNISQAMPLFSNITYAILCTMCTHVLDSQWAVTLSISMTYSWMLCTFHKRLQGWGFYFWWVWSLKFHCKSQFIFLAYFIPQSTKNKFILLFLEAICLAQFPSGKCCIHHSAQHWSSCQNRRTAFDLRECRRFTITSDTASRKCGKWHQN